MYDLLFIGGGLGYAGAVVAAKAGLKVALVEKDLEHLGGTCLHEGCIPSKYLLHLSETAYKLKDPAFRIHKDRIKLDVAVAKKAKVLKMATKAIQSQCERAGVDLVEATGYVREPYVVDIGSGSLKAKSIIIATGSSPFVPDGIEYDKESIITSDEALNLRAFPSSIAIYGSGAIGLEMASHFAINGTTTTLIYRHEHISNTIHPKLLTSIEKQLQDIGVTLAPNQTILEARPCEGRVRIVTDRSIQEYDKLLVATGRTANVDVVRTNKIEVDRAILTDDFFRTTLPDHYAIGDCNGKLMLAHAARAQVLNVVENLLHKSGRRLDLTKIPKFIYTIPLQYATVGTKGSYEGYYPLSAMALPHLLGIQDGGIVLYADERGRVAGAQILAPYAEELIGVIATALMAGMDIDSLRRVTFPHPTISEAIDGAIRRLQKA